MRSFSRREFLNQSRAGTLLAVGGLTLATAPGVAQQQPQKQEQKPRPSRKPQASRPRLDPAQVQQFVAAAHRDLDQVRRMWEQQPALVNATWDWGAGDWETALGGAAHTGRKEIALFLLEKGARLDVFAAAMLGKLDVVRAAVAAFPGIVQVPGPHRIPLIDHARAGKEDAVEVLKFLESLKPA